MKHVPRLTAPDEARDQERQRSELTRQALSAQIRQMQEERARQEPSGQQDQDG